jgi:hypothetical protein
MWNIGTFDAIIIGIDFWDYGILKTVVSTGYWMIGKDCRDRIRGQQIRLVYAVEILFN